MQAEQEIVLKLLMTGNGSVGKTVFLQKYANDSFDESYVPTIGLDFKIKTLELNGKSIKLQLWDSAGQERFMTLTNYYKSSHGIFLLYDISDRQSFNDIQNWLQKAQQLGQEGVPKMLIGNKTDLNNQRQITFEEGKQFADLSGISFLETSAKDGLNVQQAILSMINEILAKQEIQIEKQ
ncbi:unnamed protein product [Paramecium sonneborni]|uniref:Uncharacterized protein n=1 Tax=Paramecium sonneborni TaxID=65129 RepID=A0A8S1PJP9_9CILI|nr:unnamed protein product [Paramecium sonneborni]